MTPLLVPREKKLLFENSRPGAHLKTGSWTEARVTQPRCTDPAHSLGLSPCWNLLLFWPYMFSGNSITDGTASPQFQQQHQQQVHHIWFLLYVQGFQCTCSGSDLWFCMTYLQSAWFCTTEIQRDPATSCNGSRNKHQAGRGLWKEGRTKEYCKIPDVLTSENPHIAATNARMV